MFFTINRCLIQNNSSIIQLHGTPIVLTHSDTVKSIERLSKESGLWHKTDVRGKLSSWHHKGCRWGPVWWSEKCSICCWQADQGRTSYFDVCTGWQRWHLLSAWLFIAGRQCQQQKSCFNVCTGQQRWHSCSTCLKCNGSKNTAHKKLSWWSTKLLSGMPCCLFDVELICTNQHDWLLQKNTMQQSVTSLSGHSHVLTRWQQAMEHRWNQDKRSTKQQKEHEGATMMQREPCGMEKRVVL